MISVSTDPRGDGRMPLRQHLDELRGCLLRSFGVVLALFLLGTTANEPLVRLLIVPWDAARDAIVAGGYADPGKLVYIGPAEPFMVVLKAAFLVALIAGSPYVLYEVWRFVAAGLYPHERSAVMRSLPFAFLLMALGMLFGFLVLLPLGLRFLGTLVDPGLIASSVTFGAYFSLLITMTILMGAVFELPLLMWLVVRAGLVRVETLASSRKAAILACLVFGAVMTPPDVVTQFLVAVPMIVLYEIGLIVARRSVSRP